jgi:hypothetical protein
MYTSFVLVAMTGSLVGSTAREAITWHDYSHARTMVQTSQKPLAVFIGSGANGYEKVSREGSLSPDVLKMLEDSYLCVYVDTSTPVGQKLASEFGMTNGKGLVLSDRTGDKQAFSHSGDLSAADLNTWVKHFADPNVAIRTTMNIGSSRVSMYPPTNGMTTNLGNSGYVMYGAYPGGYTSGGGYMNGGMFMGGGGCPGGNCYRR